MHGAPLHLHYSPLSPVVRQPEQRHPRSAHNPLRGEERGKRERSDVERQRANRSASFAMRSSPCPAFIHAWRSMNTGPITAFRYPIVPRKGLREASADVRATSAMHLRTVSPDVTAAKVPMPDIDIVYSSTTANSSDPGSSCIPDPGLVNGPTMEGLVELPLC